MLTYPAPLCPHPGSRQRVLASPFVIHHASPLFHSNSSVALYLSEGRKLIRATANSPTLLPAALGDWPCSQTPNPSAPHSSCYSWGPRLQSPLEYPAKCQLPSCYMIYPHICQRVLVLSTVNLSVWKWYRPSCGAQTRGHMAMSFWKEVTGSWSSFPVKVGVESSSCSLHLKGEERGVWSRTEPRGEADVSDDAAPWKINFWSPLYPVESHTDRQCF